MYVILFNFYYDLRIYISCISDSSNFTSTIEDWINDIFLKANNNNKLLKN